jgi:hypothetical protein
MMMRFPECSSELPERFRREWQALAAHADDTCEITGFGGPRQFISLAPTGRDYEGLARAAYLRDDLTVEQFEAVLDSILAAGV